MDDSIFRADPGELAVLADIARQPDASTRGHLRDSRPDAAALERSVRLTYLRPAAESLLDRIDVLLRIGTGSPFRDQAWLFRASVQLEALTRWLRGVNR